MEKKQPFFTKIQIDSLIYEIETQGFYKDIAPDIKTKFDTSNFQKDQPSGIETGINKKVIGMMKDEAGGRQITEFFGLRSKCYSFKIDEEEEKKCKGITESVVKNTIRYQDYKDCLFSGKPQMNLVKMLIILLKILIISCQDVDNSSQNVDNFLSKC